MGLGPQGHNVSDGIHDENDTLRFAVTQYHLFRSVSFLYCTMRRMNKNGSSRLAQTIRDAGYKTVAEFARDIDSEIGTVRSHANGNRGYKQHDARRYAAKLNDRLLALQKEPISWQWLLFGSNGDYEPTPVESPDISTERDIFISVWVDVRDVLAASGITDPLAEAETAWNLFNKRRR